ncbi:hypothetical protein F7731_23685 [Cytobacillus depressus]|uniref:YqaJ viral recombinase domain-containing protein n=1 Tax=Cytobacillus depressus TaxID=1602942 RepID=A0A6L3UZN3_9BACI|nr:YqaJ viral recombinase family protein [Cytobacillus depressus]KAB2328956.1 hypothetical protein F7731_23685 [Cytobacillus depressus]
MSKVHAKKLYNTKNMSRKEWLMARKSGIGGSEAASLAGLNKYSSALAVWMDKMESLNEVEEAPPSEAAEWGNRLENLIREKFKENHPEWRVQRSFIMWQHPKYKWMLANVDGLIFDPQRGWGILEVKTASEWRSDEWGDEEITESYLVQAQHYMEVLGLKFCMMAVLIGGNKYKEFYIERDEELIQALIQIEKDFWQNHVEANVPPEPDGSESAAEVIRSMHPATSALPEDEILELEESALPLIQEYDEIKQKEKEMKKRKEEIAQKLQGMLGDYKVAAVEDRKVTWKPSNAFNENELEKENPEIFKQFSKIVLDKDGFKKAYPKMYKEYMLPTNKKTFSVKEDMGLYAVNQH